MQAVSANDAESGSIFSLLFPSAHAGERQDGTQLSEANETPTVNNTATPDTGSDSDSDTEEQADANHYSREKNANGVESKWYKNNQNQDGVLKEAYPDKAGYISQEDFNELNRYLDQESLSPTQKRAVQEFWIREGGWNFDGEKTYTGITKGTLDDIKGKELFKDGVTIERDGKKIHFKEEDITLKAISENKELWVQTFKKYHSIPGDSTALGASGGLKALDNFHDKELAATIVDIQMTHGYDDKEIDSQGYKKNQILQASLNDFLPEGEKLDTDGILGEKTYNVANKITANPETKAQLLHNIKNRRIEMAKNSGKMEAPGWQNRFAHYTFWYKLPQDNKN